MAPPVEKVVQNPLDINHDGIRDNIGSYSKIISHKTETATEVRWHSIAKEMEHAPVLRYPGNENELYPFDRYEECPVPPTDPEVTSWSIRELGGFDAILNSWVRFYNPKRTMSFMPGEPMFPPHENRSQIIRSVVVFVDEKTDTFRKEVYAQLDSCRLVLLDESALVMADGERLDMEKVHQWMMKQHVPEITPGEKRVANALQVIESHFADQIGNIHGLSEEEKASALPALREKAFAEIQNLSKSFENLPHGWENGALTLIGFPMLSHPILAEKSE